MEYKKTSHPEIFRAEAEESIIPEDLAAVIDTLRGLAQDGQSTSILHLLDETIPDGNVKAAQPADLTSVV
jgi:hypothetical protein